jgi:hypothetical protein
MYIYCIALEDVGKKHTTVFMPLAFVAAQIIRTQINFCGNLIHLDLLVCYPVLFNGFYFHCKIIFLQVLTRVDSLFGLLLRVDMSNAAEIYVV